MTAATSTQIYRHPARRCEVCGRDFRPQRSDAGWCCSAKCRMRRRRLEQAKAMREQAAGSPLPACEHCDKGLTPDRATQRFCDRKCQVAERTAMLKARRLFTYGFRGTGRHDFLSVAREMGVPLRKVEAWLEGVA